MAFRHAGDSLRRHRIENALLHTGISDQALDRWRTCGRFATIERALSDERRYRVRCFKCRNRWCPACGRERSRIIASNLLKKLDDQPHRLVTLTLKHHDEPLTELLDRLLSCFKKLRATPLWKTTVRRGIAFVEVKHVNGWHPHLHLLVQGNYMPHTDLRKAWLTITKDSHVVDVRLVRDNRETFSYVAKYASKPLDRATIAKPDRLQEAITAMRGRKTVFTFGEWRGWRVTRHDDREVWVTVAALVDVLRAAKHGDQQAKAILKTVRIKPWIRKPPKDEARYDATGPPEPD